MRPALTIVFAIALSAALASCSSAPAKLINPPRASIQQLTVYPDGHWQLTVRLQNFSNVSTVFQSVNAKLVIAGQDAGTIVLTPGISVGPEAADVGRSAPREGGIEAALGRLHARGHVSEHPDPRRVLRPVGGRRGDLVEQTIEVAPLLRR